jgi:hypothetical protein
MPLKAITRGYSVLFPLCMWSPSTLLLHLHFLHSPPSHTIPVLQFCLSLLMLKLTFKGVPQCIHWWLCLSLISSTPSVILPYPSPSTPLIIQQPYFVQANISIKLLWIPGASEVPAFSNAEAEGLLEHRCLRSAWVAFWLKSQNEIGYWKFRDTSLFYNSFSYCVDF